MTVESPSIRDDVDVLVVGGGLGGIAATLALCARGHRVLLTEPTAWLGGQLTSQLVPSDEHLYIEHTGCNASYRRLRGSLRAAAARWYPLTASARQGRHLNPGHAWVSPVSVEPRLAAAVIEELTARHVASGRLQIIRGWRPVAAETDGDHVTAVTLTDRVGTEQTVTAPFFVDATELGDLLPLTGVEFVTGREAQSQTGEPGAAETADPTDMQSVAWCFIIDHLAGADFVEDQPEGYEDYLAMVDTGDGETPVISFHRGTGDDGRRIRSHRFAPNPDREDRIDLDHRRIPPEPDLWSYRRVLARQTLIPGSLDSDIVVVNWPMNDYAGGPIFSVPDAAAHWDHAKGLSKALFYWLQTQAPRQDGGTGWPGMRLRPDLTGTEDGYAMHPYIRESRRIRARRTIVEQDISIDHRTDGAASWPDAVGVGHYYWIDRHATTGGQPDSSGIPHPFEIPLSALVPQRTRNLMPAAKNIGTTQITNGCYRLHPVEWGIGDAVGECLAHCLESRLEPHQVLEDSHHLAELQRRMDTMGFQRHWPAELRRWTRRPGGSTRPE